MKSIEATGKTVKDAIRNGLAELGCDSDDVDIQVVEMGSPGLFGMFGKPAKVRLTVKAEDPALDIEMPVLTLDAGTSAGVEVNMPVVTSEGVVGRITEVGRNWSRVTTILESGTLIGAYMERTDEVAVAEGVFALSGEGRLRLNYVRADSSAQVGDRVLSSGYGSVYPRGLVIGYIDSMEVDPFTRGMAVTVQCAVDYAELSRVMILTSFETTVVEVGEE